MPSKNDGGWNMARGIWYGVIILVSLLIIIFYGIPLILNTIYGWSNPQNLINWWFLFQISRLSVVIPLMGFL